MNKFDKCSIVFAAVMLACFVGCLCYDIAHQIGYKQGNHHTQLYYESRGEFPGEKWLEISEGKHYKYTQDIEISLIEFNPIEVG